MKPDKKYCPPEPAVRFLRWFIRDDLVEEVQGDLEEQFLDNLETKTPFRARLRYWLQVLNYLRPFAIKNLKPSFVTSIYRDMFRHNMTISIRNISRHKLTFLINLTGLSTGLACSLLIFLWVNDEMHMDRFHEWNDQLFQVMANHRNADGTETWSGTPGLLADALKEEIPGVIYAVSGTDPGWFGEFSVSNGDRRIRVSGEFASRDFFNVFSFKLLEGEKNAVLTDKSSIVISGSLAGKLFDKGENPIGRMVEWQLGDVKKQFIVSGVFEDVPAGSSLRFDVVLPFDYFQDEMITYPYWDNNYAITYLVLDKDVNIGRFNNKIADFAKNKGGEPNVTLFVQQYSDNYLYGNFENGIQSGGRIEYVRLFSLISIFILVIACINFMNLSTARASRRTREVGIKKTIGAGRGTLILQHLGESLMITFFSLVVAVVLAALLLPTFNEVTGKTLSLNIDPPILLLFVGICTATGLLAGSYPALYLSGFNPVAVLKGKLRTSPGEVWVRKGLVVFQFVLTLFLIVSVLVVYKQIKYVQTKNLGFKKDNIIYLVKEGNIATHTETFITEIKKLPGVMNAAQSNFMVGHLGTTYGISWEGKDPDADIPFYEVSVGYNALELLGLKIQEGRSFKEQFITDSTAVIFNQAAIDIMGLNNPVGKKIVHYSGEKHVIGVVNDFNMESLYQEIKPMMIKFDPDNTNLVLISIKAGKTGETLAEIQTFCQNYNPGFAFTYRFLDADYQALYATEERVSTLSRYFAGLAIVISCLGLFGLAAHTAERRTKEIGIRKILGAGELGIIRRLSGDFTMMVMLSAFIAFPLSFVVTKSWLNAFAYHIRLEWWFFVLSGLLVLAVAWLTVGYQTIKAARINPVNCLKDE